MHEILKIMRIDGESISFLRPISVVRGRLVFSGKKHYSKRGRVRYRYSGKFLVAGEKISINKLEDWDYSVFSISKGTNGFRIVLPVWKIDDPKYCEGKHFFAIFLLKRLKLNPCKEEVHLSYKSDEALFKYSISEDGTLKCEITYMPDPSSPSTCGAKMEIVSLDKIRARIIVGETSTPFFSKKFKINLLPEVNEPKFYKRIAENV